MFVILTNL